MTVLRGWSSALLLLSLVACSDPSDDPEVTPGTIAASVVTGGEDLDPGGYVIKVDGVRHQTVGLQGTRVFEDLEPGTHVVDLVEVAANCAAIPAASRAVTVDPDQTTEVTFLVTCYATGIVVSATTTGTDVDPSYRLTVDGGDAGFVLLGRTARITRLSPGAHEIGLEDVAPNCLVHGANPRSVTVPTYAVVPIAFEIDCVAAGGMIVFTVETTGLDRDPSGYLAEVDGVAGAPPATFPVPPEGRVAIGPVAVGSRTILIKGVAANCTLDGGSQRIVTVPGGRVAQDTARVALAVDCRPGLWRLAFVRDGVVMLASADGAKVENVATGTAPAWSPDGSRLAFGCAGLCITDLESGRTTVLPIDGSTDSPVWRPDGSQIAFVGLACIYDYYYNLPYCTFDGLYLIDVTGSNRTRIALPVEVTHVARLAWSPDGSRLAFECATPVTSGICFVNPNGSSFRYVIDGSSGGPAWKPDGTQLAIHTTRFGFPAQIATMNPDGTGVTPFSAGRLGLFPAWSKDGTQIVFSQLSPIGNGIVVGLARMNADGTAVTQLTTGPDVTAGWRP